MSPASGSKPRTVIGISWTLPNGFWNRARIALPAVLEDVLGHQKQNVGALAAAAGHQREGNEALAKTDTVADHDPLLATCHFERLEVSVLLMLVEHGEQIAASLDRATLPVLSP